MRLMLLFISWCVLLLLCWAVVLVAIVFTRITTTLAGTLRRWIGHGCDEVPQFIADQYPGKLV